MTFKKIRRIASSPPVTYNTGIMCWVEFLMFGAAVVLGVVLGTLRIVYEGEIDDY